MSAITITDAAQDYLADLLEKQNTPGIGIRIFITQPGTQYAETCIAYCKPGEEKPDDSRDHGGGDTLAASIASALAHGYSMPDAVAFGKEWVTRCLAASYDLGAGHGPVSPLWRLHESEDA